MKLWEKILAFTTAAMLLISVNVCAFTFPEPDWGTLLNEKTEMVTETDFELYTEGPVSAAPYYGAKFEPTGGTYIGMVAESSHDFLPLGSYLTYIQDMWQDDLYYPANEMIANDNVITIVGWTIDDLNNINYDQIRNVLDRLNTYNKPMLIRFANEMNVSALGDDPDKYIEIFRTVANMIHEYPNFGVVWAPNDMGALDRPFEYFYPGDEYVDWIGVSCYSIKYFQGDRNTDYKNSVYFMTGDYAWATNRVKPIIDFMQKYNINKPVMISEGGVTTENQYGEELTSWTSPRLRNMLYYLVMKYPQIKMINHFNTYRENEAEKFYISNFGYATDIFNEARACGAYITSYGGLPEFVFEPANAGRTLTAKDNMVKLYTLAYIANSPELTVNYSVDGNWYHSSNQIPYTCNLNIADIANGMHTLTISTTGHSKEYTFFKHGNLICFGAEPDISMLETPSREVTVTLNGEKIEFDQPPIIDNGRTLVPLRAIFEKLGADIEWDDLTQTVTAQKDETVITLQISSTQMWVNGEIKTLDVPAQLINSRTLVPVRAISEAFSCSVDWDESTQTVIIAS